jgi:hypothetical protein
MNKRREGKERKGKQARRVEDRQADKQQSTNDAILASKKELHCNLKYIKCCAK